MRILYIDPNIPQNPGTGSQLRSYHFLKNLSRCHDFTVLCPSKKSQTEQIQALSEFCHVEPVETWQVTGRSLARRIEARLRTEALRWKASLAAIVWPDDLNRLFYFRQACRDLLARKLTNGQEYDLIELQHSGAVSIVSDTAGRFPLVTNLHNVCWPSSVRQAAAQKTNEARLDAWIWRKIELKCLRTSDLVVTVSEVEAKWLRKLSAEGTIACVPNGTDTSHFLPPAVDRRVSKEILFCGPLNYQPNVDAVEQFLLHVWPRILAHEPQCTFSVVGKEPPYHLLRQSQPRVHFLGWVDDIRPFYQRCAAMVVPLRFGGGTRLKILDALSSQTPLVCTPFACEGIDIEDGKHAFIRKIGADFADALLDLIRNRARGEQFGRAGRTLVVSKYDWKNLAPLMDSVYQQARHHFQLQKRTRVSGSSVDPGTESKSW